MERQPSEFVTLFVRHQRRVYAYLLTVLGNSSDAEDVLQQTAVVLWTKFDEFEPGTDFAAWAIRTAYLTARNHLRGQSRSRVRFSQAMFEAAADHAAAHVKEADLVHDALDECLKHLPMADRDLIRCRYELDTSVQSIAQRLEQSIHAVYRSLARIHSSLLRCVTGKIMAGD